MRCVNHPEREADLRCNHCGQSICSDCQVQVKAENYCRECMNAKASGVIRVEHSPVLAGILSFVVPGLGQVYNGQYGKALAVFFTCWLIFPWVIGIVDAARTAVRIADGRLIRQVKTGCIVGSLAAMFCGLFIAGILLLFGVLAMSSLEKKDAESPREEHARTMVKMMSTALENYARNHDGIFPDSESKLIEEHYLTEGVSGVINEGYSYTVTLSPQGYSMTAEPVICSPITERVYSIIHPGEVIESSCRSESAVSP